MSTPVNIYTIRQYCRCRVTAWAAARARPPAPPRWARCCPAPPPPPPSSPRTTSPCPGETREGRFCCAQWRFCGKKVIRYTGGSLLDMPKFPLKSEVLTSNIYLRSSLLPPAAAAEPELGLNKVDTGEGGDIWVR